MASFAFLFHVQYEACRYIRTPLYHRITQYPTFFLGQFTWLTDHNHGLFGFRFPSAKTLSLMRRNSCRFWLTEQLNMFALLYYGKFLYPTENMIRGIGLKTVTLVRKVLESKIRSTCQISDWWMDVLIRLVWNYFGKCTPNPFLLNNSQLDSYLLRRQRGVFWTTEYCDGEGCQGQIDIW